MSGERLAIVLENSFRDYFNCSVFASELIESVEIFVIVLGKYLSEFVPKVIQSGCGVRSFISGSGC